MCTIDNDGVVRNFNVALATIDPSFRFGVIPTLTNSLGQTRNTSYSNDRPANAFVIPASSENVDLAIKFLDWCYSEEGTDVNNLGKEGVSYDNVDGVKTFKEEILAKYAANGSNAIYDMSSDLGIGLLEFTPRYDTTPDNQVALYLQGSDEAREAYREVTRAILNDPGLIDVATITTAPPLTAVNISSARRRGANLAWGTPPRSGRSSPSVRPPPDASSSRKNRLGSRVPSPS
jgi:ABC-type glycerol-3-phosphate transport system substrate-binding protein